jgi:hypothetical protein
LRPKIAPQGFGVPLSGTSLLAEASLPSSNTSATVYALLVPPKHTMSSPTCTRQDNKIALRGVGVSLSGTPLLAEASLCGAMLSGTSLSGIMILADASLLGASKPVRMRS